MTAPMPARQAGGRGGGRRGDVLAALRASPAPVSILDLAARLDLHPNTVRFHLDALVSGGQAERVELPRSGPGRPAQMFRAYPGMDPGGPRNYQVLAQILLVEIAGETDPPARATRAGRTWGRRLSHPATTVPTAASAAGPAVDALVDALDDLGFAPEFDGDPESARILLRHCPFLELTRQRPALVCAVHLGLMQGVLDARNAPVVVEKLEPFVRPNLCLAHLGVPD